MNDTLAVWSCRRFEILYRDVVLPLLRRSDFQRQKSRDVVPIVSARPTLPFHTLGEDVPAAPDHRHETTVIAAPRSCRRPSLKTNYSNDHDPSHRLREKDVDSAESASESEADFGGECAIGKDAQIQRLWKIIVQESDYFVRVLGHGSSGTSCSSKARSYTGTSQLQPSDNDIWKHGGCRDFDFDVSLLKDAIEVYAADLVRVPTSSLDSSTDNKKKTAAFSRTKTSGSGTDNISSAVDEINAPEAVARRQAVIIFLVELLSSRLNLHQIECLRLILASIQASVSELPAALRIEECCFSALVTRTATTDLSSSLTLTPFGASLGGKRVASCCQLGVGFITLQENILGLLLFVQDLYPLDQSGVGDSRSVGLIPLCFFKKLIAAGFMENAMAALKFLMLESTRQRAQLPNSFGDGCHDLSDLTEWVDRAWSRRLAHIVVRILLLLVTRFHASPYVLLGITEFLEGAAFEEPAIRKIRETVFQNENDKRTTSLTARDFDFAAVHDERKKQESLHFLDPWVVVLETSSGILDMTSTLVLLFLEIVDPSVAKWDVLAQPDEQDNCSLSTVQLPTASFSAWLAPVGTSVASDLAPMYQWLRKKSADHDIEPFWVESTVYGRILSFAVSVAYTKPSDTRRLQLALSSSWNLFSVLTQYFLDRLVGSSALAKIAIQTLDSLLQQTFLPLNTQWTGQIIRIEKLSRMAQQKNKLFSGGPASTHMGDTPLTAVVLNAAQPSFLEPVVALLNRICSVLPTCIPQYALIFFALVDSFPWLDLTSVGNGSAIDSSLLGSSPTFEWRSRKKQGALHSTTELCEVDVTQTLVNEEDVPSHSGVGFPLERSSKQFNSVLFGKNGMLSSEFEHSNFFAQEQTPYPKDFVDYEEEPNVLRADDVHFLLPLFIEVVNFAATLCASGHRNIAAQVATKLTSQPSLLGFFIPHTTKRLQELFTAVANGLLQRQYFSAFQEQRNKRLLRLRRGESYRNAEEIAESVAAAFFDDTEDDEEGDKALQLVIDHKISSVLASTTAVFRFFVAALSPRLFLTQPAPPPLLPQSGPNVVSHSQILNWAYVILAAHARSGLGVGELDSCLNGFQLLNLKACVLDGLAGSFETTKRDATHILGIFVSMLLPTLTEDFSYLSALASDDDCNSSFAENQLSIPDVAGLPKLLSRSRFPPKSNSEYFSPDFTNLKEAKARFGGSGESIETSSGAVTAAYIRLLNQELLGRLATSFVTYVTSVVFRLGYRERYRNVWPDQSHSAGPRTQNESSTTKFSTSVQASTADPALSSSPAATKVQLSDQPPRLLLFSLTQFVVSHIIPILKKSLNTPVSGKLDASGVCASINQLPSGHHWRLTAVTFKFLRCILRGPLPLLGKQAVDAVSREPFGGYCENDAVEDGARATAWLMQSFLALDSVLLDSVLRLTRCAWQQLLSPWDTSESNASLAQIQTVEAGLDTITTLFQRDAIFLCWWEALRQNSTIGGQPDASSEWEFVSGLLPVHHSFVRDAVPVSDLIADSRRRETTDAFNNASSGSETYPRAIFIFELISSDRYRDFRKQGIYLLHQLNQRDARCVAALLSESTYYLESLQTSIASILRDIELEEFEHWDYLDHLGVLSNSDFPIPDLPEALLSSFFVEEMDKFSDYLSADARLRDALSVWSCATGMELSRFHEEIADTDLPTLLHQSLTYCIDSHEPGSSGHPAVVESSVASRQPRTAPPKPLLSWTSVTTANGRGTSSLITSRYTGLPIHRKLERRIVIAEEAAVLASDTAAWNVALNTLDNIPEKFCSWVASALPHIAPDVIPPLPFLIPDVAAKMVLNTNGHHLEGAALFEEAVTALRRETYCGASAPKTAAKDPVSSTSATPVNRDVATRSTTRASVPLTAQVTYAGPAGATSRSLCLQFLLQGVKQELSAHSTSSGGCTVPTVLQLLGFVQVPNILSTISNSSGTLKDHFTTALPLPFITSPFLPPSPTENHATEQDGTQPLPMSPWLHNSMVILDSIFLFVEDGDLWINELPGPNLQEISGSIANSAGMPPLGCDALAVQDVLTDPYSYSNVMHRVYHEARNTLFCLEFLTLLLTDPRTSDALLYLLFVRLPHRHAILNQLLTARWNTSPPLLASVKKLICGSWVQLMMYEAYLCSSYMSQNSVSGSTPAWIVTSDYPPAVFKARLDALQHQCRQVSDGIWALLQSPLGYVTATELSALGLSCPQGTPTLLSSLLMHLAAAERFALPQMPATWGTKRNTIFRNCVSLLGLVFRCDGWSSTSLCRFSFCDLCAPLLHPYQVLVQWNNAEHRALPLSAPRSEQTASVPFDPVSNVMDFNIRSLTVFAAQRLASRLAEFLAASFEFVTVELGNSAALFCENEDSDSLSLSSMAAQKTLSGYLLRCIEVLRSSNLASQRSRYCLVSVVGSLINALLTLVNPHAEPTSSALLCNGTTVSEAMAPVWGTSFQRATDQIPVNRAFLRLLLKHMFHLCVDTLEERSRWVRQKPDLENLASEHDPEPASLMRNGSDTRYASSQDFDDAAVPQENSIDSRIKGVDRVLRLRFYLGISQILGLAKFYVPEQDTPLLSSVAEHDASLIEQLLKQLLTDLLHTDVVYPRHPSLVRPGSFTGLSFSCVYAQDANNARWLFPGLVLPAAHCCVPLLKTLIDFDACRALRLAFSPSAVRISSAFSAQPNDSFVALPGHSLTPDSHWTPASSMVQAIQAWISSVFPDFELLEKNTVRLPSTLRSYTSGQPTGSLTQEPTLLPLTTAHQRSALWNITPSAMALAQLALSLIRTLADQPALCETILATASPVQPPAYMITAASVNASPLSAVCRTVLLAAPFLPRVNAPFTLEDFGFPTIASSTAMYERTHEVPSKRSLYDTSIGEISELPEIRCKPVTPALTLLPVYLSTLHKILSKLQYLDIDFTMVSPSDNDDDASRGTPATVQRASFYFFRWWLSRDRQFSFCFRCFRMAVEELRLLQTKNALSSTRRRSDAPLSCADGLRSNDLEFSLTPVAETERSVLDDGSDDNGNRQEIVTKDTLPASLDERLRSSSPLILTGDVSRLFATRFKNLSYIVVLTSRIWLQLLGLVLTKVAGESGKQQAEFLNRASSFTTDPQREQPAPLIPFDDILLTLQFQSHMVDAAVFMMQLSAYKNILDAHDSQVSSPFQAEAFRSLLPVFPFQQAQLNLMLPDLTLRRQFVTNTTQAMRREFEIAKELVMYGKEQQLGPNEGQQIREQLKRSILERTQALVAITNAAILGLLSVIPLERKTAAQLVRDIEAFLYIPRWNQNRRTPHSNNRSVNTHNASHTATHTSPDEQVLTNATTSVFYLRVLSYTISFIKAGLQMLLGLEGVNLNLSAIMFDAYAAHGIQQPAAEVISWDIKKQPSVLHASAVEQLQPHITLLRRTLSAVHSTLGSGTQLRALRLCGRSAAAVMSATDVPGFSSYEQRKRHFVTNQPLPLSLLQTAAKVVCVEVFTLQSFLVAVST